MRNTASGWILVSAASIVVCLPWLPSIAVGSERVEAVLDRSASDGFGLADVALNEIHVDCNAGESLSDLPLGAGPYLPPSGSAGDGDDDDDDDDRVDSSADAPLTVHISGV